MESNNLFSGVITALVTPFRCDKVDFIALEKLIKKQIDANVDGILLFGSTGEPLSLSDSEKRLLFFSAKEIIQDKLPILTGISSPITKHAVASAKTFEKYHSDGLLLITPYYYRCTSEGMFSHFFQVANATTLPIIAYNVPSRTNFDLACDNLLFDKICSIDNICAIKMAESNKKRLYSTIKSCKKPIFCGCDENMFFACRQGAIGSISVISNAYPSLIKKLHDCIFTGKIAEAEGISNMLNPIISLLSTYPNPIAIKCLLSKISDIDNQLRLPLTIADDDFETNLNILLDDLRRKI